MTHVFSKPFAIGLFGFLLLAGCAAQPSPASDAPGLFLGFGHGIIAIPALFASMFFDVRVYAFPNSGFFYDLGFCIGFGLSNIVIIVPLLPIVGGFLTRR